MKHSLTPWARGALGVAKVERLTWHVAGGWSLDVGSEGSPYRFVVTLRRLDEKLEWRDVGRAVLFERICQMLEVVGVALPTEAQFQRSKELAEARG
jgi:hypothetical protein